MNLNEFKTDCYRLRIPIVGVNHLNVQKGITKSQ